MRRLFLVAISTIILLSGKSALFADASGINLLSQSHEIWGGTLFNGILDEYHLIAAAAIEGISRTNQSKAGNYSVSALSAGNDDTNIRGAYACSSYLFLAEENELNIKLDGYIWYTIPETAVTYRLTDTTAAATLDMFTYSSNTSPSPTDSRGNSFYSYDKSITGLESGHIYELYLCAIASTGDGGEAVLNANLLSVSQIPAPSAILLCSAGILITGWLKRRKSFH
ncbi:MAG: hypothetical protein FVQ82_16440 [Planctomycetes bacterium]|nr:hypothetical protein [Planctomycetota bacterium]